MRMLRRNSSKHRFDRMMIRFVVLFCSNIYEIHSVGPLCAISIHCWTVAVFDSICMRMILYLASYRLVHHGTQFLLWINICLLFLPLCSCANIHALDDAFQYPFVAVNSAPSTSYRKEFSSDERDIMECLKILKLLANRKINSLAAAPPPRRCIATIIQSTSNIQIHSLSIFNSNIEYVSLSYVEPIDCRSLLLSTRSCNFHNIFNLHFMKWEATHVVSIDCEFSLKPIKLTHASANSTSKRW